MPSTDGTFGRIAMKTVSQIFSARNRALPADLAASVAHELFAAETIRRKSGSRETPSLWRCLARALALINTRQRTQVDEAERLLKTAISIDPASAPAHSLLSFVKTLRVHLGWQLRSSALPAALQVANKALALDPDEPWGHLALGYATFYTQPGQAVENLEDALKLDPTLAMAHYLLALVSAYTGDCEQAFDHADSAEALAAQDLLMRGNTGAPDNVRATTCFVAGRYSDGVNFARHTIAQSPGKCRCTANSSSMARLRASTSRQHWRCKNSSVWRPRPRATSRTQRRCGVACRIRGIMPTRFGWRGLNCPEASLLSARTPCKKARNPQNN